MDVEAKAEVEDGGREEIVRDFGCGKRRSGRRHASEFSSECVDR